MARIIPPRSPISFPHPMVVAGSGVVGAGISGWDLWSLLMTDPNANGTMMYNFAGGYPEGSDWTKTHEATGGPGGTPCVRVDWLPGRNDYNYGWWAPTLAHTFVSGESIFMGLALKYHNALRWSNNPRHKMIVMGSGDSRCILYGNYPSPSAGGALGWRDSGGGGAFYPHAIPSYFGLGGISNDWSNAGGIYGSVKIGKNITTDCAGPALLTYGNNPSPPAPGPNSAAPTAGDCWYWIQAEIRSGSASSHYFKVWVNNNDYNNPTVVVPADQKTEIVGATGWQTTPNIGQYLDNSFSGASGQGYRLAGAGFGTVFHNSWYPGP